MSNVLDNWEYGTLAMCMVDETGARNLGWFNLRGSHVQARWDRNSETPTVIIELRGRPIARVAEDGHIVLDTKSSSRYEGKKRWINKVLKHTPYRIVSKDDTWVLMDGRSQVYLPVGEQTEVHDQWRSL